MKLKKRAAFDIQNFLVTIVLFIGITVTFGSMAVQMSNDYNAVTGDTVSSEFSTTYDQLSVLEDTTNEIDETVFDTTTGSTDAATNFFGDALNTLKLITTSLGTTKTMMTSMAVSLGISEFWFRILSMILIIMLVTVIIFMIFRYR